MTYNVFGGTLNLAQFNSILPIIIGGCSHSCKMFLCLGAKLSPSPIAILGLKLLNQNVFYVFIVECCKKYFIFPSILL